MTRPSLASTVARSRAILFDLDGTLIDSIHDIAAALNEVAVSLELQPFTREEVIVLIGAGDDSALGRACAARGVQLGPDQVADVLARFTDQYDRRLCTLTRLFPGVAETLTLLKRSHRLGLVTNKPGAATERLLDLLDLRGYFDVVLAGDWGGPRKPAPHPILQALALCDVQPADALMVGDSASDIDAARAAGVGCVAVSFGYSDRPVEQLAADTVIHRLSELCDQLPRLATGTANACQ